MPSPVDSYACKAFLEARVTEPLKNFLGLVGVRLRPRRDRKMSDARQQVDYAAAGFYRT